MATLRVPGSSVHETRWDRAWSARVALSHAHRSCARPARRNKFLRTRLKQLLVRITAEVVSNALINRMRIGIRIDLHAAHDADGVSGSRDVALGINRVRIRILPPLTLVFNVKRGLRCDSTPK